MVSKTPAATYTVKTREVENQPFMGFKKVERVGAYQIPGGKVFHMTRDPTERCTS